MAKKLAFDVCASPVSVPEARRDAAVHIPFNTMAQALDSAFLLLRAGWRVYRVSGPDGFELTEELIGQYCNPVYGPAQLALEEKNAI